MASERKKVPQALKRTLRNQTGGKCANPGCLNRRLEYHHIKEWAVYQANDEKDMVAICPTCHDAVHHGEIPIDDATVRRWKAIKRYPVRHGVLQIEPGKNPWLVIGTVWVRSVSGVFMVFGVSEKNRLTLYVDENDFYLIDLTLTTPSGEKLIDMKHNRHVHSMDPRVKYMSVPGHIRIVAPRTPEFAPAWVEEQVQKFMEAGGEKYPQTEKVVLLDMEVVGPSQVKMSCYCVVEERALVATEKEVLLVDPEGVASVSNLPVVGGTAPGQMVFGF